MFDRRSQVIETNVDSDDLGIVSEKMSVFYFSDAIDKDGVDLTKMSDEG